MKVANLDYYHYEIREIYSSDRTTNTVVYIELDSESDPSFHDIVSEIARHKKVYVDGRYFMCIKYHLEKSDTPNKGVMLVLFLKEV